MLLFKKKFLPAIRSGQKKQTIRLWKHPLARSGQRSYIPGVGYIQIESVEPVELAELTTNDAIADGFVDLDSLRTEIEAIYGDGAGKRPYRLRFRVLPEEEQAEIRRRKQAAKKS